MVGLSERKQITYDRRVQILKKMEYKREYTRREMETICGCIWYDIKVLRRLGNIRRKIVCDSCAGRQVFVKIYEDMG